MCIINFYLLTYFVRYFLYKIRLQYSRISRTNPRRRLPRMDATHTPVITERRIATISKYSWHSRSSKDEMLVLTITLSIFVLFLLFYMYFFADCSFPVRTSGLSKAHNRLHQRKHRHKIYSAIFERTQPYQYTTATGYVCCCRCCHCWYTVNWRCAD